MILTVDLKGISFALPKEGGQTKPEETVLVLVIPLVYR